MSGERSTGASDGRSTDVQNVLEAVMRLRFDSRIESEWRPSRLRVESGDAAVELEWHSGDRPAGSTATAVRPARSAESVPEPAASAPAPATASGAFQIRSPMVGSFYHAPGPDEPPFVKVGEVVSPGQQIGIVEAMKLMNPIEAEEAGRVVEILVPNAGPVEYDQPLIALVPVNES